MYSTLTLKVISILILLLLPTAYSTYFVKIEDGKSNIRSEGIVTLDQNTLINKPINVYEVNIPSSVKTVGTNVQWNKILEDNGLIWLHEQGYNGTGIRIGFIDNGIDFTHPAFNNVNFVEKSFADQLSGSTQTHGTPVSGVVVGYQEFNITGTAPGAYIASAEMGSNPEDTEIKGNFTEAIEWLVSQNVTIVNTSFGGLDNWSEFIAVAKNNNMIIVGSAGNDGINYPPSGPAAEPYGIGVGAMNVLGGIEFYSSRGPTYRYIQKPDIVGYGNVETINVVSGIGIYSGTSFSSPLIAGGIASVLSGLNAQGMNWTVGEVKASMINSSYSIISEYNAQGAGTVNFTKMYEELIRIKKSGTIIGSELIEEYKKVPIGINERLPIQVVGSLSKTIEVEGNISSIFTISIENETTELPLYVNTIDVENGYYSGSVLLKEEGDIIDNRTVIIEVVGTMKGKVGFDYIHSDDYINGEETLLNSNEIAKGLRQSGFRPYYMFDTFTLEELMKYKLIIMKNILEYNSNNDNEDITENEIDAIHRYIELGGHVIFAFSSPEQTDQGIGGIKLEKPRLFLEKYGINVIGELGTTLLLKQPMLRNESSYGRSVKSISHRGFEIEGGKSLFTSVYKPGIVINDSYLGRLIVSSSTLFFQNTEFVMDLIIWITGIVYYNLHEVSTKDKTISIEYDGGEAGGDEIKVTHYDYNEEIKSVEYVVADEIAKNKKKITINASSGKYSIEVMSQNNQYLKISYKNHNNLILDFENPTMYVVYPTDEKVLLLNQTAGQLTIDVRIIFDDNNEINESGFEVSVNNVSIPYGVNKEEKYLEFIMGVTTFGNSLGLEVIVYAIDLSGNVEIMILQLIREIPIVPPEIIDRTEVLVSKVSDGFGRDDTIYGERINVLILMTMLLLTVPLIIKMKEETV